MKLEAMNVSTANRRGKAAAVRGAGKDVILAVRYKVIAMNEIKVGALRNAFEKQLGA